MDQQIRILLLDDSTADCALVTQALMDAGIPCDITCVADQPGFVDALAQARFDLVLSDYFLGSFSGLTALEISKQRDPRVPFLLVSGSIGEELAVEALHRGVTDYVAKDRLIALAPAVERAVAEAEKRQKLEEAEEKLRESHREESESETRLMEAWPDSMVLVNPLGKIVRVNRQTEVLFGYLRHELIGQEVTVLMPPRFRAAHRGHVSLYAMDPMSRTMSPDFDFVGLRKSGEEFPVAVALSPVTTRRGSLFIATLRDITEPKRNRTELIERAAALAAANEELRREQEERSRIEAELRMAQHLEAIGQLAAGIAHEINTPMQFIGDSVHFLQKAFMELMALVGPPGEGLTDSVTAAEREDIEYLRARVPRALERTIDGINRVTAIVRAMKDFSRPVGDAKEATDLNRALKSALVVAHNEYKYVADVETEFEELPLVPCFSGEINQVFLNLIVNGAHAIADAVNGTDRRGLLRIRTRIDGATARIEIQDSGNGIPATIRDRIFNPFFTTKAVGRGTGQGLAIARSIIVGKHGGALTFETELGVGTTFCIRLPLVDEMARNAGVLNETTHPVC